jgi:hypothetical protein
MAKGIINFGKKWLKIAIGHTLMVNIAYALWDRTEHIENQFLKKRVKDSHVPLSIKFPNMLSNTNVSRLITEAVQDGYSHLVCIASGVIIRNAVQFKKELDAFCRDNTWMVSGHIIAKNDEYPYFSPQVLCINIQKYVQYGSPSIGAICKDVNVRLPIPYRSEENIHDDHTPLWLGQSTGKERDYHELQFGWHVIMQSLLHGDKVKNIPVKARNTYRFLYWWHRPDELEKAYKLIDSNIDFDISSMNLNVPQKEHIAWLNTATHMPVFVFNTEPLLFSKRQSLKKIIGCASGFQLFALWYSCGACNDTVIYHFDINGESLNWQKGLQENWQGDELFQFFIKWTGQKNQDQFNLVREHNRLTDHETCLIHVKHLHDAVGGKDAFINLWKRYANLRHEYHCCNIVSNPESIIDAIEDNSIIWYSNIFNYIFWIYKYGLDNLKDYHDKWLNTIRSCGHVGIHVIGQSENFDPIDVQII